MIARGISNPLAQLCAAMRELASGNFGQILPGLGRKDEIGDIAKAVAEFKVKAQAKAQFEADEIARRQDESSRRSKAEAAAQAMAAEEQTRVVETLAKGLRSLSDGNLRYRLNEDFPDIYQPIKDDFNLAMAKLEQAIQRVNGNMQRMYAGTQEISGASDDLSRRTEQQAASLEETSVALKRIVAAVDKTAAGQSVPLKSSRPPTGTRKKTAKWYARRSTPWPLSRPHPNRSRKSSASSTKLRFRPTFWRLMPASKRPAPATRGAVLRSLRQR
jgi:methyl-accepting chemotaxis protein